MERRRKRRKGRLAAAWSLGAATAVGVAAWVRTRQRAEGSDGMSRETGLNMDWKKTSPKVLWKVPLGAGFSSMSIVDGRIYTMCQRGSKDIVVCLRASDGKELWTDEVAPTYLDKQKQGPGPRSTPTYHGGKLYCLMPMGELVCVSADGKRLWTARQFKDTGARNPGAVPEFYYWGA